MKILWSAVMIFVAVASALGATSQSYERYRTIVDRQMFGPLPPGFDPDKLPSEVAKSSSTEKQLTQEQEAIKKSIRFMAINRTENGEIMVGFADFGNPKKPITYYMKVGETQNGWTVREVDIETAVMTIVNQDGIEVTLKLGGDSSTDAGAVSKSSTSPSTPSTSDGNVRANNTLFGSLRDRRRLREAQTAAEEKERAEREAAREAARKAEREAEREEQRRQLQDLKDEIRRMSEARATAQAKESEQVAEGENPTTKQEMIE